MASVQVFDQSGKKLGKQDLAPEVFEAKVSVPLMHQVVVAGMAAVRRGTHSTKTRGEVRGGGRKPWRQKGTGRARHGSIRSPIWAGGGVAHGPRPRDHSMRVNRKMRRAALRSALSDALEAEKLAVIKDIEFDEPKTKKALEVIDALELDGRVLIVLDGPQDVVERSFRNIPFVRLSYASSLSVYEVVAADKIVLTKAALDLIEGRDTEGEPAPAAKAAAAKAPKKEKAG